MIIKVEFKQKIETEKEVLKTLNTYYVNSENLEVARVIEDDSSPMYFVKIYTPYSSEFDFHRITEKEYLDIIKQFKSGD